jgi:hypothetical protein
MQRIDETNLEENGWHPGTLKHVKLLSFPDPANSVTLEAATYSLKDFLGNSLRLIGSFIGPSFHSDSLVPTALAAQWHSVQMNRQEYIAVVVVSYPTPIAECNVLVSTSGDDRGRLIFQGEMELTHEPERDIFLPVSSPDRTWISTAMTSIQADSGGIETG